MNKRKNIFYFILFLGGGILLRQLKQGSLPSTLYNPLPNVETDVETT
jgi:hypothetical protein